MKCKKCNGKIMLDDTYSSEGQFELYCLMCGYRCSVNKSNAFGRWLKENAM